MTTYEYDSVGRLTKEITPLGYETKYIYSDAGKLVEKIDAMKNSCLYDVNGNGFTENTTDPMGFDSYASYGATSQIITSADREGNVTTYT